MHSISMERVVSKTLQGYFEGVTEVLQGCYRAVLAKAYGGLEGDLAI
jgi:hypothetical protein